MMCAPVVHHADAIGVAVEGHAEIGVLGVTA
jgi:hypothetical protein